MSPFSPPFSSYGQAALNLVGDAFIVAPALRSGKAAGSAPRASGAQAAEDVFDIFDDIPRVADDVPLPKTEVFDLSKPGPIHVESYDPTEINKALQRQGARTAPQAFRDSAGRLRNVDGTFAFDGGSQVGGLHRPSLRADTRRAIEAAAPKNAAGQFVDSRGNVLTDWHFGHIRGHENRRILAAADELSLSQSQLNDYVNARPQFFQIEDAARNLSHAGELPGTNQRGPILRDMRNFFGISR